MKDIKVYPVTPRMPHSSPASLREAGRAGWGKGVYWLLVTGYCLLLFITACQKGGETQIGHPAPGFRLKDIKGGEVTLNSQRGRVVLLRFWSTRCPSCKEEMPALEKSYEAFRDKGLEVLAINVEDTVEVASNFTREMGLTYPILMDREQKVAGLYSVYGIPTSFFIDKDGIVRERVFGDVKEEAIAKIVTSLSQGGPVETLIQEEAHEHSEHKH
ncbi:MAG: TlpA family protein disulfide reductase [Deltaproteobacteria bacterium]|nr:TlpA family protein disulfide reductase [Deltaproteobacteria bacterium]